MIRKQLWGGAASITASGVSVASSVVLAGTDSGNSASRSSTQVTRHGRVPRICTRAWPTWPAPKITTCRGSGRTASRSTRQPCSGSGRSNWSDSCAGSSKAGIPSGSATRTQAAWPGPPRPTSRTRPAVDCRPACRSPSQARSASRRRSNSRWTLPPQHCPRAGPSGRVSIQRSEPPSPCRRARADSAAFHSRWPPPMVSHWWRADTSIFAPASRGVDPWTQATVTSTTACCRSRHHRA